jgi:hypothetical protein
MKAKILLQLTVCAAIVLLSFSCQSDSNPLAPELSYQFAMFFLADSNLSFSDIETITIRDISLLEIPFLTHEDIETFTVMYLGNNPIRGYELVLKDTLGSAFAADVRPFVLVLRGARYCIGEYWPNFMDTFPGSILLYRTFPNRYHLVPVDYSGREKLRNPEIIETLEKVGVPIEYRNTGSS